MSKGSARESPYSLVRDRDFRLYWLGQTSSRFGGALVPVATAFAVLAAGGGAGAIGLVLAVGVVTEVLSLVFGGVWADRLHRRAVMMVADGVRALSQGSLAVLIVTGDADTWHFALVVGVNGVCQGFFSPAAAGLVQSLVPAGSLRQAHSLLSISGSSAAIAGPALAGVLVAWSPQGAAVAIATDAVGFLLNVVALASMRSSQLPPAERQTFLADLGEGWREVRTRPWLSAQITWDAFAGALVGAPLLVLGPVIADERLGGPSSWGLIVACFPVGAVLGGLIALRWRPRRPLLAMAVGMPPAMALPNAALALALPVPAIAATEIVAGAAIAIAMAMWATLVQQHVPAQVISRVSSIDAVLSFALLPVGYALAGPLASSWGAPAVLWASVAWALLTGVLMVFVRSIRQLRFVEERPDADHAPSPEQVPA